MDIVIIILLIINLSWTSQLLKSEKQKAKGAK